MLVALEPEPGSGSAACRLSLAACSLMLAAWCLQLQVVAACRLLLVASGASGVLRSVSDGTRSFFYF